MVDGAPPWDHLSSEQRVAEDAERARKLIEEAEKRRKREEEEREKALTAESRLRAQGTNQRFSGAD